MTWTTARPTQAGWYWCRGRDNSSVGLVRLWYRGELLVGAVAGESGYYMPQSLGNEWQGPIEPEE